MTILQICSILVIEESVLGFYLSYFEKKTFLICFWKWISMKCGRMFNEEHENSIWRRIEFYKKCNLIKNIL